MSWQLASDRPIYIQLVEQIQFKIISGEFLPGDKLASVRDLAAEATVNPNTMQRALSELERKGLIITQRTAGRYITEDRTMLKTIKEEFAMNYIRDFLERMNQLGFSDEQTVKQISELIKEEER